MQDLPAVIGLTMSQNSNASPFEVFAALQQASATEHLEDELDGSGERKAVRTEPTASEIVAYARRQANTADFRIEARLRTSPRAYRIYTEALRSTGAFHSELARAAASGGEVVRWVDRYRVRLIDERLSKVLLIDVPSDLTAPDAIEARTPDGAGARVQLGLPIDDMIQLSLDPRFPELDALRIALEDPTSEIFLFSAGAGA